MTEPVDDSDKAASPRAGETAGYLHSVETGAAVDGPGVRFVFFMSGCLFRCKYCHNPDTWKPRGGRKITLAEAIKEVRPYKKFLKMAGGVTVSGGEPLMQSEFVGRLLHKMKFDFGLHTALDTQGFLHANVSDDWFDVVDLVLLDIKHINPEKYLWLTGQPLQPTLDFARRLHNLGKRIWIRYVLVPGITDGEADISGLADFILTIKDAVDRVEVLPFHQMGAYKWKDLGLKYELQDTKTPTAEEVAKARAIFSSKGLSVR